MTWQIAPFGNDQFFTSNGTLAVGYKIYTYLAGTTTKEPTAAAFDGSSNHTNPIVLNSIGLPPSPIYIDIDKAYKFVYATPTDTDPPASPLYTADNITVKNLTIATSQWLLGTTPTYINATQFSIVGDQRTLYHVGRRVQLVASGSTVYGVITASAFTTVTTVTVLVDDGLTISASLNTVYYGLLSAAGSAWPSGYNTGLKTTFNSIDARTNTVSNPVEVNAQTTGTPAVGIGTGMILRAESADETPSDFGQWDFSASTVSAGAEQTYFRLWLRVAGSVLTECWRWASTSLFKGIFTHANTADRTYTLPNRTMMLWGGNPDDCPTSVGAGSTRSHEGTVTISSNQNLSGVHFYDDFTLNSGITATVPAGDFFLAIYATGTITINGTIDARGAGSLGGTASNPGVNGTDQIAGDGGSGASGGRVTCHGVQIHTSGQFTAESIPWNPYPMGLLGGASGGGGSGASGGRGGGSILLVAPTIVLAGTATLNTSGNAGGTGGGSGGGGGGGAGNVYICCHSFTDNGATFTQTAGSGGSGTPAGSGGQAGVKQINIY